MKKQIIFLLAIAMFLVPQYSFAKSKIELAREYLDIGENYAASDAIRAAILEDPSNSSVHYQAGMLYLRLNNLNGFEKSMDNACKLSPKKCSAVSQKYYEMGLSMLGKSGNTQRGINFLKKSVRYTPKGKSFICEKLFTKGKSALAANNFRVADASFYTLINIDATYKSKVTALYIEKTPKSSADAGVFLLKRVVDFDSQKEKSVAKIAAKLAKSENYSKKERKKFKQFAKEHLSKQEFTDCFPPDTIYLEPDKLYVSPTFKKGEMSKFWIAGPRGAPTHRHIGRRGKKHLALLLDNGKVYNYTQGELPPKNVHYKFKFIALEDGAIGLAKYTRD